MKVPQALLGGLSFALVGNAGRPALVPMTIDPDLYMGRWYVLACTENPAESSFVDAVETYTRTGDRKVDVLFEWKKNDPAAPLQKHTFKGHITSHPSSAVWRMHLFPLFTATYIVIAIGPSYAWAAVGHPSRKFGWILARQPQLTNAEWQKAFSALAAAGYDTRGFRKVAQSPAHPQ